MNPPKEYVTFRTVVAVIATALAIASVYYAVHVRGEVSQDKLKAVGELHAQMLIGFWAFVPPIWFQLEWSYFTGTNEKEHVAHSHGLSRNIWLALVVILAVITGIKSPFVGG